jgi:hypothetical protein
MPGEQKKKEDKEKHEDEIYVGRAGFPMTGRLGRRLLPCSLATFTLASLALVASPSTPKATATGQPNNLQRGTLSAQNTLARVSRI